MECISACVHGLLFCVLCQPVHSCIEPFLTWALFLEIFLWGLVYKCVCIIVALILKKGTAGGVCRLYTGCTPVYTPMLLTLVSRINSKGDNHTDSKGDNSYSKVRSTT